MVPQGQFENPVLPFLLVVVLVLDYAESSRTRTRRKT